MITLSAHSTAITNQMGITVESVSESDDKNAVTFSSIFHPRGNEGREEKPSRAALIILNYPIPRKSILLKHLWKTSSTRIAADGGANRLYEHSKELIPDLIRGDLDSLEPKIRSYYEMRRVSVERDVCQKTNDLDKAIKVLVTTKGENISDSTSVDRIVIYGAFGGRFDQEMASFSALYKWAPYFNGQLYLYSDETCAFLIPANKHCEIRLPFYDSHNLENLVGETNMIQQEVGEGPTCGIIPLGCRCDSVITSGLKWDLDGNVPLEFGGIVSSSNRIMKPIVKVYASHPLIFTAELLSKNNIDTLK